MDKIRFGSLRRNCLLHGLTLGLIAWLGITNSALAGAPAPFTWNASTRIVVDDNMQYVCANILPGAGWTNYWTNIVWSADVTNLTCVGWYNVVWPGARPSHNGMLPAWSAVRYLSDGINRMIGIRPVSVGGHSYPAANAIVLTTLSALRMAPNVPADLLANAVQALAVSNGAPLFSANEAYYIHTESKAIYIVANQMQGLTHGVVELLLGDNAAAPQYQIGYEKLGMGPDWTYVPDFFKKPLIFNMEYAGRPGLYSRGVCPTRGSQTGATGATIAYAAIRNSFPKGLPAPDEPVELSDLDWVVGFRIVGCSSPGALPSQNMEQFHPTVAANMVATGSDKGFMCVTKLGLDAIRPPATKELLDTLWLDTDTSGPNKGKIFWCTLKGSKTPHWLDRSRGSDSPLTAWCPPMIDLSVPAVRQMLLKDMITQAESHWSLYPGKSYSYPHAEPSDGGLSDPDFEKMTTYPNWYSDYRKAEGQPWGAYKLNGFFRGTPVQPTEDWWHTMTPVDLNNAQADTVYAYNNWLLREFDKYVKSLPAEKQQSGGIPKSKLIHTLCYSYGNHDVPPNFNFDQRVRMCVSIYTPHRSHGKWQYCQSLTDVMHAMKVMLPESDFGQYWVLINSYPGSDWGLNSVGYESGKTPEDVYSEVHDNFYAVGGRNLGIECDEDHGKLGLTYYMYAKLCWEPTMSLAQLKALRDRWINRCYGTAAFSFMSQYYDYITKDFVSSYSGWARAIQFIQQADAVIPGGSPEKQRLNDLKQFWYYYYLQDHFMNWDGSYKAAIDPAIMDKTKELLWKGQTSYINPLYCITWGLYRHLNKTSNIPHILDLCAPTYYDKDKKFIAPAHYTETETATWWADVVKSYPYTPVTMFKDSRLVTGELGADVDLNNLTTVTEFSGKAPGDGVLTYMPHHAVQPMPLVRATKDGDPVGLKVFSWLGNSPEKFTITYSVDRWDPKARDWQKNIFDDVVPSVNDGLTPKSHEVAVLTYSKTVSGGIYRLNVGSATGAGMLSSLDFDTSANTHSGTALAQGLTFAQRVGYANLSPQWYIYIPKGTTTLDVEVDDGLTPKNIDLYTGLPSGAKPWKLNRTVDIHGRGTHQIALQPGEDGSIACLSRNNVNIPHFYSIPNIGALAPWMLMVPKDIATADGLTPY